MAINKKYLAAAMNSRLFEGIEEKRVKKFLVRENLHKAKKNEVIVNKNESKDKFFAVILKGGVVVTTEENGNGVILHDEETTGMFGTSMLFSDDNSSVIVVTAVANTVYLKITDEMIKEMAMENPKFACNFLHILNSNIRCLIECIKGYTASSAEKKIALSLRQHMEEVTREDGKKEYRVALKTSMTKLAASLNLGRASLYRAIGTLEDNYVILRNKKEIRILDVKKLEKICEEK